MAARLLVIPYTADPTLMALLEEQGLDPPGPVAQPATVDLLEEILAREGWHYRSRLVTGAWEAHFLPQSGRRPPIKQLSLGSDGTLDFGAGPLYGPWHVSQEVARSRGPRVAVLSSGKGICPVTGTTSYETFHQVMTGRPVPADRSDLEWDDTDEAPPPRATSSPTLLPSPEEALEVALSGGPGHEHAATQVGRALQAYRWSGPPSPPLTLDARRQKAIVERLRGYVRETEVPATDLVWALGQADGTREDLAALVVRLAAADGAAEAVNMARVFLR